MRPLRPPIRDDYTNSYSNNNPTPSKLRPPIPDQNRNNNNSNNNINNPFPSQTPKFSKPNNIDSQKNDDEGQNNSSSFDNDDQSNTSEQAYKAQNKTPMHKTSQKHKTPDSSYNINPTQIPRPNQFDEIYFNNEKLPFYETNIGTPPPHSTTFYSVKETQNSSCRFIRPTLNSIPISQSLLNETNLLFGICVQPFAEIPEYEASIPKVESGNNIFRCRQCNSYINNKYNISFSAQNKQVAICNLCQYENELDINKPGIKSDYLNSDYSNCPELTKPTVDFIAPTNFKASKIFVPHYLFMIDISETSFQLGLPSYVINSIQSNLESVHNKENSYIGFGLYDQKNIYYFYIEKDNPRLTIMGDIINPFCPVSLKKLFLKLEEKDKIDKLIETLNNFIEEKNQNVQASNIKRQISTITGAAIKSGVESLLENGGRLMIFTSNPCNHGFGACSSRDKFNKEKEPLKANPFYPQHEQFVEIGEKAANNRIVIDQFIFMSTSFDLSTFSIASNLSGGQIEFYNYTSDPNVRDSLYEKLHYDLTRILTRPNYYDCKFMLRFTVGVDCVEILGPFNKKLGEAFQLGGCDPDYCYFYNMRLNENFKKGQKIDIQLVILFDDNYGSRYLRIFNYSFDITNEVGTIFTNAEVDAISKAMIYKEISLIYKTDFKNVRMNLENKIINSFKYYRVKEKSSTPSNQLILPVSIRYLPLYVDSFLKTGILSNHNNPEMINQIIYIMNKLLREPIYSTTKFLYPKFYRIDDIEKEQINSNNSIKIENIGLTNEKYNIIQKPLLLRLSKDIIDFDCAYLIDNGCYIYIFIFNHIEGNFYKDIFGVETYEEAKSLSPTLNEENESDLNQRLLNIITQLRKENSEHIQPIRLFFFEEGGIKNPILVDLLKEDKIDEYDNYPAYLCSLHREIQERIDD
jgi:protein transport protein SEC24